MKTIKSKLDNSSPLAEVRPDLAFVLRVLRGHWQTATVSRSTSKTPQGLEAKPVKRVWKWALAV